MVSFDQNTLYIIVGIILIVIILLAIFMRRRGSKKGPSNINKYLDEEAKNKKVQIVEKAEGFKTRKPLYKLNLNDKLKSIRAITTELEHKNIYQSRKIEDRIERLDSQEKKLNPQKQLKTINQKDKELNSPVKSK